MVGNVDSSDCKYRCVGKNITRDLSLVASRLSRMAVPPPQSRVAVTPRCRVEKVDASLTLISRMRQGACSCSFSHERLTIYGKWMSTSNRNMSDPRCIANNFWYAIDAHTENGAVTVWLSVLPIITAIALFVHNCDQITVWLLYIESNKTLMLCWQQLRTIVHSTSAAINNSFHGDLNIVVVILTNCDLAFWQSRAQ